MVSTSIAVARGARQSNIELLRIVSMLFVLALHANFYSIDAPTAAEIGDAPLSSGVRLLMQSLTIVAVNVFVMISGWFGIRPSVKGFTAFAFQCLFYSVGIYAVAVAAGFDRLSASALGGVMYAFQGGGWFVGAYAVLYLLAPVLNAYIEKASVRQLGLTVAAFYAGQSYFGWLGDYTFFEGGNSTISFVGLYLLSAWLRRCGSVVRRPGLVYLGCSAVMAAGLAVAIVVPVDYAYWRLTMYLSPLMVAASAGLLLWFARLDIGSRRWINTVAASAFAVYLIHMHPSVSGYYRELMLGIYDRFSSVAYLAVAAAAIVAVFAGSVLIDRLRLALWSVVARRFFR